MNYTSQSYGAVYEECRINQSSLSQMLISIIILIYYDNECLCRTGHTESASLKRQEQQQERYVDGLKKSVKVQKSNQ